MFDSKNINEYIPIKDVTPDHIKKILSEFTSRGTFAS